MNIVLVLKCKKFIFNFRLRVNSKRPSNIKLEYFDEEGNEKSTELSGFKARLFLHEFDHLLGIPFIDWKISQGEIEILEEEKSKFINLSLVIII